MLDNLPQSWRQVLSAVLVVVTATIGLRYMLVAERVPNYERVLSWFQAWWP